MQPPGQGTLACKKTFNPGIRKKKFYPKYMTGYLYNLKVTFDIPIVDSTLNCVANAFNQV